MGKRKKPPNFRNRSKDLIGLAAAEHLTNENIMSVNGYGRVIGWIEKKRPIRLMENLFKDGIISTWPPQPRDQLILIGVHSIWRRKDYLKMQLVHFSKYERKRMVENPDFKRLQEWIYGHYENSGKRYVKVPDVIAELKNHFRSNNVLPAKGALEKLAPEERKMLLKKQASIDAGLAKLVRKVRHRWDKQREQLRKENPGLGYGQRVKIRNSPKTTNTKKH